MGLDNRGGNRVDEAGLARRGEPGEFAAAVGDRVALLAVAVDELPLRRELSSPRSRPSA